MQKGFEVVNLHGTASGVIATPYIGENGNWWIGNEDTDIHAKGGQGEQGVPGPQGAKGVQGDTGPRGIQGVQGDAGPQGSKGDPGIQGPVGPIGPQGEKGQDADEEKVNKLRDDVDRLDGDIICEDIQLTPTGAENTYSLDKNLADYRMIGLVYALQDSAGSSVISTVPVSFFRKGFTIQVPYNVSGGNRANFRYINDTTIVCWSTNGLKICGFRFPAKMTIV